MVALACASLLIGGAAGWRLAMSARSREAQMLPALGRAPEYSGLTDQLGQTVDSTRFRGKVQVVTFLFPYCTTYCPLIAAHLVGLERLLALSGLQDRVALVAFNVDPGDTGPGQMRAFLKEYGWNPRDTRWEFLTGAPQAIRRIVTQGYHVAYEKVPDSAGHARGPAMTPQPEVINPLAAATNVGYDIVHNDAVEIVDPRGRIRQVYTQADVVSNGQMLGVIKTLLRPRKS